MAKVKITRESPIQVMLSEDEKKAVENSAREMGMTMSAYCRWALIYGDATGSPETNPQKRYVNLCRMQKSGKPGKAKTYEMFGSERCAEDVIDRLEKMHPGSYWIEA